MDRPYSDYFEHKYHNIQKAKERIKKSNNDLAIAQYTKYSVDNSEFFRHLDDKVLAHCTAYNSKRLPDISIVPETTTQALYRMDTEDKFHQNKYTILDFADFIKPGGMFLDGSMAQEESLCHNSNLFNILNGGWKFEDHYWNNARDLITCYKRFSDAGIMIPDVAFSDPDVTDDVTHFADVIVLAAPDRRRMDKREPAVDELFRDALRDRIRMIFKICYEFYSNRPSTEEDKDKKRILILGAFGCGVFCNDPKMVATFMLDCFEKGYANMFDEVVFAIPAGVNNAAFIKAFKDNINVYIET